VSLPSTSTIANAMGRTSKGLKWLSKNVSVSANLAPWTLFDHAHRVLIQVGKMCATVNQNQPCNADEISVLLVAEAGRKSFSETESATCILITWSRVREADDQDGFATWKIERDRILPENHALFARAIGCYGSSYGRRRTANLVNIC